MPKVLVNFFVEVMIYFTRFSYKLYPMKKTASLIILIVLIYSCKKETQSEPPVKTDPYSLPWKTEFISFKNIQKMCSSHGHGYTLFYKDSSLISKCEQYNNFNLSNPKILNDSTMLLFQSQSQGSTVLKTINGGLSWKMYPTCYPLFVKYHTINERLTYCISTYYPNTFNIYDITGIGKSNLVCLRDTLLKGRYLYTDLGTELTNIDSTKFMLNDSVEVVIRFN